MNRLGRHLKILFFFIFSTCIWAGLMKVGIEEVNAFSPRTKQHIPMDINKDSDVIFSNNDSTSGQPKSDPPLSFRILGRKEFFPTDLNSIQTESLTIRDPAETRPSRPSAYCWVPNFIGPIQQSPLTAPTPFLYQPFDMAWDGSGAIWSSNMDHMNPNYKASGGVASLGEVLSNEYPKDQRQVNNYNYDYYFSPSLEIKLGYDGHDGNDFRTLHTPGVSALAAASGKVIYTRNDCHTTYNDLGCYIEIYHPQGYLTRYAHLDSVSVNKNDWVEAGKPIGIIGTTGNSTGIHLHFSVFHWNSYRTVGSQQGEWEVTDPFGWDPWLPPEDQNSDPLINCNGEISYNLWVNGWPQKVDGSPSPGAVGPDVFAVGGWLGEDLPYICPSPSNGTPRDNGTINNPNGQVTFTWSPPSCEGVDYYTFRVSNHNDIDNPPWIIDHGVSANAISVTETIPSSYIGQTLYWAIWPHNINGYGTKGGPWAFKIDTSSTYTPPSIGTGEWTTTFYGDVNLNSQCGGQQNFPQTYVFKNWGESAPVSGCPDNNWSARMERDVAFPGGDYTFALEADDWARIYVDNQLKVDHWNGATGHYEGYIIPAGTHRVRIEFADTAGNARVSAWWKGSGFDLPKESEDFSQWFADYWPYPDQYWDSVISVKEGYGVLDHQWGNGEPSYGLPADGFSARFRRDFDLNCGTYQFNFNHDDGINFKIDGEQQFDRWNGPIGAYSFTRAITQGVHRFEVNYHETGGSANINFTYQQLSGCNPSSPTLQNPSNSISLAPNSDITLSWLPTSNASQYYVKLNGGPGVDISSGWLDTTSYYIGGLWPGVYTWSVTSRNEYGSSSPSASWSFTIESAPSLPDIVVENITPSSYSPVVNEPVTFNVIIKNQGTVDVTSGFYVDLFLDTEPGSCGSDGAYWWRLESLAAGATTDLTATLGGITPIGAHNAYVFADSACEITEEDDSNNISGPVVIDVKESTPSIPSDFRVMGSTQSSITLAWSDTSNESGYGIYEWNGTNFYLTHSLGANITSFTDTGLNCGNVYYYELSAYNTVGESTHAGWIEGATSDCPVVPDTPSIPSDFRVTGSTQSSITMAWSDTSNETGYHIYEWNGIEPYLTHTLGANTTQYTDTGLDCGTEYAYALSAYNAAGEAGHAGWIEGSTSDCPVIPANSKIYLPIIMASSTFQTVPFGLGNPYFEMTFDTSKWKAGPLRLGNIGYYHLFSRNYPDCYIDDLWQHGWDPSRFYLVDSYETHANISFHFQIYYRTGTTNPAFSIIKWGPGEKYVIEIVSIDAINADWSCFNEGKEVLWRSAERGFD